MLTAAYRPAPIPAPPIELIFTVVLNCGVRQKGPALCFILFWMLRYAMELFKSRLENRGDIETV